MVHLELTEEELGYLVERLDVDLSDIRMEIADTDSMSFKLKLRERELVLLGLIQKLKDLQVAAEA